MKYMNKLFVVIFSLIAITCLAAAIFYGAPWHFGSAVMSASMATALAYDETK